MNPLIVRIGVALLTVQELRKAIERNDNVYSGGLVPNLQSITDILTLSPDIFNQQLEMIKTSDPQFIPTDEMLTELQATIDVQ
jgi:hypothetical protein